MTLARLTAWTMLAGVGFALVHRPAAAQDPPLPSKKADALEAVSTYKETESRGIPAAALSTVRNQFQAFANYYGEMVKHPLIYKHAQDPSVKEPNLRTIPPLDGPSGLIPDMQRFIVEPTLFNASRVTKDRGDYIRELGSAFDNVLKPIINENPERIIRINATRMLAASCKSGATAHYETVTAILTNANTPPYVKHYALVAAGNLLSAYDVYNYRSRRHSNGWKNDEKKGAADKELAELVVAIEKHITDPTAILNNVPNLKAAEIPPDQQDVVRFIRRQAIRALGELRFAAIPSGDGKTTLYPAFTLARLRVRPGARRGTEPHRMRGGRDWSVQHVAHPRRRHPEGLRRGHCRRSRYRRPDHVRGAPGGEQGRQVHRLARVRTASFRIAQELALPARLRLQPAAAQRLRRQRSRAGR